MKSLTELVDEVARELKEDGPGGGSSFVRADKLDIVNYMNEGMLADVMGVLRASAGLLEFISSSETPDLFNTTVGMERLTLPPNFWKTRAPGVEIKWQDGSYFSINEEARTEGHAHSAIPARNLSPDTTYWIRGPFLYFVPKIANAVTDGIRLWQERTIPKLLMGKARTGGGINALPFASVVVRTSGQNPAEKTDDIYNGIDVDIGGDLTPARVTITDYAGPTQTATVAPAMSGTPTANTTYSMVTPFAGKLSIIDDLMRLYALVCGSMGGRFQEDETGFYTRYNNLKSEWKPALKPQTPGSTASVPFDVENG